MTLIMTALGMGLILERSSVVSHHCNLLDRNLHEPGKFYFLM